MGLTLRKENSSDEEANFRSGEVSVSIPATETNSEIHRQQSVFSQVVAQGPPYECPNPNKMTRDKYWELVSRRAKSCLEQNESNKPSSI